MTLAELQSLGKKVISLPFDYIITLTALNTFTGIATLAYKDYQAKQRMKNLPKIDDIVAGRVCVDSNLNGAPSLLNELKNKLPEQEANNISLIGTSNVFLYDMQTYNLDPKTGQHAIIIGDGLFGKLTIAQAKALLAHEISHASLNHLNILDHAFRYLNTVNASTMIASAVGTVFYGFMNGFYPSKQLATLITLFLLSVAIAKGYAKYSQHIELQADTESVRLNGDAKGLISALETIEKLENEWKKQPGSKKRLDWPHLFSHHPELHTRKKNLGILDEVATGHVENSAVGPS